MITVNNNMKDEHQGHLIFVIMLVAAIFYAIFVSEVKARGHIKHWAHKKVDTMVRKRSTPLIVD